MGFKPVLVLCLLIGCLLGAGWAASMGANAKEGYVLTLLGGIAIAWVAVASSVSGSDKVDKNGNVANGQACGCALGTWGWMAAVCYAVTKAQGMAPIWHPFMLAMLVTLTFLWQWLIAVDSQLTLLFLVGLSALAMGIAAGYPDPASGWLSVPLAGFATAVAALVVGTLKRRRRK